MTRDVLTLAEIERILPHRPPMRMIDGVSELSEDRIVAYKSISPDDPHFAGHFPGEPILPGVFVVEALGQAGGILAYHGGDYDPETELLLFMSIDRARFRRPVRPGDRLRLEVTALRRGKLWKLDGRASVGGDNVAEAILVAAIRTRTEHEEAGCA